MAKLRTCYASDFEVPLRYSRLRCNSVQPSRETTPIKKSTGQAFRLVEDPGYITGLIPSANCGTRDFHPLEILGIFDAFAHAGHAQHLPKSGNSVVKSSFVLLSKFMRG